MRIKSQTKCQSLSATAALTGFDEESQETQQLPPVDDKHIAAYPV